MLLLYMSHLVVLGLKRVKTGFFGQIFSTSDDKNAEKPIFHTCFWVQKGMGVQKQLIIIRTNNAYAL